MKFDSLEKNRRAEVLETHHSVAKFSHPNYNLTNIDKIQERIQKILGKKWFYLKFFYLLFLHELFESINHMIDQYYLYLFEFEI